MENSRRFTRNGSARQPAVPKQLESLIPTSSASAAFGGYFWCAGSPPLQLFSYFFWGQSGSSFASIGSTEIQLRYQTRAVLRLYIASLTSLMRKKKQSRTCLSSRLPLLSLKSVNGSPVISYLIFLLPWQQFMHNVRISMYNITFILNRFSNDNVLKINCSRDFNICDKVRLSANKRKLLSKYFGMWWPNKLSYRNDHNFHLGMCISKYLASGDFFVQITYQVDFLQRTLKYTYFF